MCIGVSPYHGGFELKVHLDEGLVHVGEFLRLLRELAPDEEKLDAKGAKEVEEMIKKMKPAE